MREPVILYSNCESLNQTARMPDVVTLMLFSPRLSFFLANSADDKLMIFFLFIFFQKTGFVHANCLQCQNLFSGKNKKKKTHFLKSRAEFFTQSAKR